ncbi:MAG: transporter [bacterium]|nr:transporter [bacterium]
MKYIYLIVGIVLTCNAIAQNGSSTANNHAPIGVMGDHTHGKGEFMLSYRYMRMNMEDMRTGTTDLSNEEVLNDYMVTPLSMNMNMHMLGFMYGISSKLTVMGMVNYYDNSMDHLTRMNMNFTTNSGGLGDTKISFLYDLMKKGNHKFHMNFTTSIPTGSIDETDVTPASEPDATQLPYPMQIGLGTWSLNPGITYSAENDKLSWGAQTSGQFRIGENDRGYSFGNQFNAQGWFGYEVAPWIGLSTRVSFTNEDSISGVDESYMNLMMVPTVVTENFGGNFINGYLGTNIMIPSGFFKGHRIALEYGLPVMQDLNGTQMKRGSNMIIGWQYAF